MGCRSRNKLSKWNHCHSSCWIKLETLRSSSPSCKWTIPFTVETILQVQLERGQERWWGSTGGPFFSAYLLPPSALHSSTTHSLHWQRIPSCFKIKVLTVLNSSFCLRYPPQVYRDLRFRFLRSLCTVAFQGSRILRKDRRNCPPGNIFHTLNLSI